ncbi:MULTISPECIES: hypothetical protein [Blastomonas]|uniref:hypothetical protein n=1 Tax=Blastomonas TaxID=150203 RepID=UPI0025A35F47|nr:MULTISPECIES: hypothetical protein [Blastomonas]MDM7957752.1 hypothetical protein [Blastomonas sp.]MDM7965142.1 hypothetical protein [Blastomonas fulva]
MPGVGAFVLIAVIIGVLLLVYRFDRTGGSLTLFASLFVISLLVLMLLMAGLVVAGGAT